MGKPSVMVIAGSFLTLVVPAVGATAETATRSLNFTIVVPRACFEQSDPDRPFDKNTEIDPMGKPTGRVCNYPVNSGALLKNPSHSTGNVPVVETKVYLLNEN